jgi:hypothetical protein
MAAPASSLPVPFAGTIATPDVVEIGLLLPADWARALVELSQKRQQSVGQLLRAFVGRALTENDALS